MVDKSSGVEFDRQVFVQPQAPKSAPSQSVTGLLLILVGIAAIAFLGYKVFPRTENPSASDPTLADLDKRLAGIETRLTKLEATRKSAVREKEDEPADLPAGPPPSTAPKPVVKTVYQISPRPRPQVSTAPDPTPVSDPTLAQRLSPLQQDLAKLRSDETANQAANQEAWQAATDKLSDMAGQVGEQGVEILRSQDELNEMLARTEMEAIPFELLRGSNPQSVGPLSLVLKSSNERTQRYTLCVYIQPSCIELKDHTLHEVVQFVTSRNTAPLEVIATKITKDQLLGYLEVPRSLSGH